MQRRDVVKKLGTGLGALGGALAWGAPNIIAKPKRFRWRLVMVIPKTLPVWGSGVQRFAENVRQMTDGALTIRVYGAGELVPAMGTLDAVKAGRVQMAHSASYYWLGKIPSAVFFTSVPFGMDPVGMKAWLAYGGGQELWDEVYEPHGMLAFPAGNTGTQMGGWFKKEINSLKDFKGLKMRIPGLGGRVIAKAGGKPMLVPGGEIYTNLSTGVIDATEWVGPYHDYVMGFYKAASHYYYPGWHEPGPVLELMINRQEWNKLPAELQAVVRSCATALDQQMYAEWLVKDAEYLEKIRNETKVKVLPYPDDVLKAFKQYAQEAQQELVAKDKLGQKVLASFTQFQRTYQAHQAVTSRAYNKAQNL